MNSVPRCSPDEDPVRPVDRLGRGRAMPLERAVHHGPGERHEQGGIEALAGDVGDDDRERVRRAAAAGTARRSRRRCRAPPRSGSPARNPGRPGASSERMLRCWRRPLAKLTGVDPERRRRCAASGGCQRLLRRRAIASVTSSPSAIARASRPGRRPGLRPPRARRAIRATSVPSTTTSAGEPVARPCPAPTSRPAIAMPSGSTTETDGPPGRAANGARIRSSRRAVERPAPPRRPATAGGSEAGERGVAIRVRRESADRGRSGPAPSGRPPGSRTGGGSGACGRPPPRPGSPAAPPIPARCRAGPRRA